MNVQEKNMSDSLKKNNFDIATAILKKTLPLLVKNHIPASPKHYSLWYKYASRENMDLCREMNDVLALGLCTETKSSELYLKHVAQSSEKELENLKVELEKMMCEMSSSFNDACNGTGIFKEKINSSFLKLNKAVSGELSIEETMGAMREMVKSSQNVMRSIDVFSKQLVKAQKEISDLKDQLTIVKQEACIDGLTELLNRRSFDLDIASFVNTDTPFSIIMGDIDHFKRLNDDYGHQVGDLALKSVAKIFITSCRENATAYRYGGEEIVMLLPGTPIRTARQIAETMRRKIEKLNIVVKDSGIKVNNITSSFGVHATDGGISAEKVIKEVDGLLYEAKHLGRNRVMPMFM